MTTRTSTTDQPRLDPRWVEARFDRIAPWYGLFEALFVIPSNARRRALQQLHLEPGDRLISVGCGHGPTLLELSQSVGEHGAVVGVDLSERMLQRARIRISDADRDNVELIHSDILQYHSSIAFNAVHFEFSLSSFGDPGAALRHTWSMLEPGGHLVVLDGRIPPRLSKLTRPLMPLIRWFMEQTVLGDPDMRPIEDLRVLGLPIEMVTMRAGAYFIAHLTKPDA